MGKLVDAIRLYFEEKNRVWITGDMKHVVRASGTKGEEVWWPAIGAGISAKRRSTDFRRSRIVRTHTKVTLKSLDQNTSGEKADAVVDELITWVYHDVEDYNVESRIIRHWQTWKQKGDAWRLERDIESDERNQREGNDENTGKSRTMSFSPRNEVDLFRRRECIQYDRLRVLRYAELWWNGFNPQYTFISADDCTNFISQCLFAGNLKMIGGQNRASGWWYKFQASNAQDHWSYSWTTSHALYLHLINEVKAQRVSDPQELKIGDVIFYDWDGSGRYHHTTVVVDFDGNGDPLVNAHTDPSYHRHYRYLDSRALTRRTKYAFVRIPDQIC